MKRRNFLRGVTASGALLPAPTLGGLFMTGRFPSKMGFHHVVGAKRPPAKGAADSDAGSDSYAWPGSHPAPIMAPQGGQ